MITKKQIKDRIKYNEEAIAYYLNTEFTNNSRSAIKLRKETVQARMTENKTLNWVLKGE